MNTTLFLFVLAALVATASAYQPLAKAPTAFKPVSRLTPVEAPTSKPVPSAALAGAFTSLAPLAAHADTVDESQVIGLGVGLVACIVSLAVGFTIGYGTLTKP
mmetsp:Transcript_23479/g.46729  ORF Transcript_23479/g.46729 Transcript_23479/m.46729 type:complete len:103 (-) Transcript_23479:169-477(-)